MCVLNRLPLYTNAEQSHPDTFSHLVIPDTFVLFCFVLLASSQDKSNLFQPKDFDSLVDEIRCGKNLFSLLVN